MALSQAACCPGAKQGQEAGQGQGSATRAARGEAAAPAPEASHQLTCSQVGTTQLGGHAWSCTVMHHTCTCSCGALGSRCMAHLHSCHHPSPTRHTSGGLRPAASQPATRLMAVTCARAGCGDGPEPGCMLPRCQARPGGRPGPGLSDTRGARGSCSTSPRSFPPADLLPGGHHPTWWPCMVMHSHAPHLHLQLWGTGEQVHGTLAQLPPPQPDTPHVGWPEACSIPASHQAHGSHLCQGRVWGWP